MLFVSLSLPSFSLLSFLLSAQLFLTGIILLKTSGKQGVEGWDCFVSLLMPAVNYSSNDVTGNEREAPTLLFPLHSRFLPPFLRLSLTHLGPSTLLAKLSAAAVASGGFSMRGEVDGT